MNPNELVELGIPKMVHKEAHAVIRERRAENVPMDMIQALLRDIATNPDMIASDTGDAATRMLATRLVALRTDPYQYRPRSEPAPYEMWGDPATIEVEAVGQMHDACTVPAATRGALMPDVHLGYGLPIGGVLATKGTVIPYAVGVDIACRMCLSVTDLPVSLLEEDQPRLVKAIERNTRFGPGAHFKKRRRHAVMDHPDWDESPVTRARKATAWDQLGTSGAGNHFVEFGIFEADGEERLALMSHSGSRGIGMAVANFYSSIAAEKCRDLPRRLKHLAWLDLNRVEGIEYWTAMELMGRYASANHELIHDTILRTLGGETLQRVENHHNFAWLEEHDGAEVVVHRKGATPAHEGVLGIIPGSMGTPAYLVEGKGSAASLCSASHGAGRKMSRTEAKRRFKEDEMDQFLFKAGVTLISGGLDESPMAYKDIGRVMAAQSDLVEVKGTFRPKLVKMAPDRGKRR
jgi:tRNA-splicing ligase RtcB